MSSLHIFLYGSGSTREKQERNGESELPNIDEQRATVSESQDEYSFPVWHEVPDV